MLQAKSNLANNHFVMYALNAVDYKDFVNGTTRLKLTQGAMRYIPVSLPPLMEQQRIVDEIEAFFTRLNAGADGLRQVQVKLKRYRAAILKAAVEGTLTEAWRAEHSDVEPAPVLLQRILQERRRAWEQAELAKFARAGKTPPKGWQDKYKELGTPGSSNLPQVPQSWCWSTLGAIAQIQLGKMLSPKAYEAGLRQLPYLRNENIRWGWIDFRNVKIMGFKESEIEKYRVVPGDLMVCEGGEAGRCAVYTDNTRQLMYQKALHRVRPVGRLVDPRFIQFCFQHYVASGAVIPKPSETTIQHLPLEEMQIVPVPLPPLEEQEQIVAEVERRLSVVAEIEAQIEAELKRAERLRQSILKQAFAGKLVPQEPEDEPASVLLERIRARQSDRGATMAHEEAVQMRLV